MRQRGIISPPRSRYSHKSILPHPRPTTAAVDPNEQRTTHRDQEIQPTAVKRKPNGTSATKSNNNNRSSSTSRRSQIAAAVEKNKNSTPKTATRTKQTLLNFYIILFIFILCCCLPQRRSTVSTGAGASGSAKDSASKKQTDFPNARNRLQKLSMDGKDVASIDPDANLIYEDIGGVDKKERRSSESNARRRFHNIYKEIASHRQENSSNITSYFTKLVALWDEPASYSEKLSEAMEREIKVMQFLLGLNDSYSTICAQILVMTPFPSVEKAFSLVIQEQKRREVVLSQEIVRQNDDGIEEAVDNSLHLPQVDQSEVTRASPFSQFMTNVLASPVRC